jgi:hypothetical protein
MPEKVLIVHRFPKSQMTRLGQHFDLIDVAGKKPAEVLSPDEFGAIRATIAQAERMRSVKRASEGRKLALAKGVKFGRKRKLSAHQQAEALKRLDAGESARSIGRLLGVSHITIGRLALA